MTANDERLIGRLTKAVGWGAVGLVITGTLAFADLKATATEAKQEAESLRPRVYRTEKTLDSLLIEMRHLPNAVADTLAARERRSR